MYDIKQCRNSQTSKEHLHVYFFGKNIRSGFRVVCAEAWSNFRPDLRIYTDP